MTRRHTLLIDTNVLIDFCDRLRPCHDDAVKLVHVAAKRDDVDLVVLVSSLKDLYYILCRRLQNERMARQATEVAIKSVFSVTDLLASYAPRAISSNEPDFEDGLVRAAAEELGAEAIVSRDKWAFALSFIPRLTPRQVVAQLST